jgi:hypothetical protein
VHDALAVRLADRVADLLRDVQRAGGRERALGVDHVGQRAPVEELHDEEEALVGELPEEDHADDVRMIERGRDAGLSLEAPDRVGVLRELGVQDLHGDGALDAELPRLVDRAHAARAEA